MAAVNKLDNSWDDLSTVLIGDSSPPRSGDQLDWASTIEDEDNGESWREPAMAAVAHKLDNSWDDLSTVLIGDSSPPRSGDQLDWSVSTIEDEDNSENWRESAMAAVAHKLDDSWDDLSTELIGDSSPPRSGDQLDWSVSMIEVEAHDDGADDDWREPTVVVVATQLDNSWEDLPLSSTSSVIDVSTLDSTWGCSILYSKDALSSILDNVMATETRR
ncbi:hypothetical protein AaE_000290, partial [Aphanomyces astaci]